MQVLFLLFVSSFSGVTSFRPPSPPRRCAGESHAAVVPIERENDVEGAAEFAVSRGGEGGGFADSEGLPADGTDQGKNFLESTQNAARGVIIENQ